RAAHLQAAHTAWLHHFPGFTVHPHDPYLERRGCPGLSLPPLSDRAHPENPRQGANPLMILSVNGLAVVVAAGVPAEFAAVRELLRQRAVAIGLLDPAD